MVGVNARKSFNPTGLQKFDDSGSAGEGAKSEARSAAIGGMGLDLVERSN